MKNTIKLLAVGGLVLWGLGMNVQAGLGLNWATPSGLVRADGTTPLLETGSALFQLIRSMDAVADPPTVGGGVSGDDEVLAQQVADASTAGMYGQHFAATYADPAWSMPAFLYIRIFDRGTSIGNVPGGTMYADGAIVASITSWAFPNVYQEIAEGSFAGGPSLDGMGRYVLNQQVDGEPQPDPPSLDITTADDTVSASTSSLMVSGTSSNLVGDIRWTNSLTGMSGTLTAASSWSFEAFLDTGTNVITASGSNSVGAVASDTVTIVRVPAPALDVTTENALVRYSVNTATIQGTIGNGTWIELSWTNSLSGASGTGYADLFDSTFMFGVPLEIGANLITVRGTNMYGDAATDSVTITRGGIGTDLPVVDISTAEQGVDNAVSSFEVSGTANLHVIGQIAWSNSLGGTGSFAAALSWSFQADLAVGANAITVRGTNLWGETATDVVILTRATAGTEPYLDITNANETVENPVAEATIGGVSSNLVGDLLWTNSLNGATGTLPADSAWSFPCPLAVGSNLITVFGSNSAGQVASDAVTIVRADPQTGTIIFRPGPGLNDGSDDGRASAGKDANGGNCDGPGSNEGDVPYLYADPISDCNPCHSKIFIQFNVDTLPVDVTAVYLGFTHIPQTDYCLSNCEADFNFYPLTGPWNEMTVNLNNQPARGDRVHGPVHMAFPNDPGTWEYEITDLYRAWKNGTTPNHGLEISSDTVGCNNAAVAFYAYSSDAEDPGKRPYLRVLTGTSPYLAITNVPAMVENSVAEYTIGGIANTQVVGQITWSNSLGGSGSIPAATNWEVTVPLAVGDNLIAVSGTNLLGETAVDQITIIRAGEAPVLLLEKTFFQVTVPDAMGNFQAWYQLTVSNEGETEQIYDLTDLPAPDENVTFLGGSVSGQVMAPLFGPGPYMLADDMPIGAGATHTYVLMLDAQLSAEVVQGQSGVSECRWENGVYVAGNGLFNDAVLTYQAGATSVTASDCGEIPPYLVLQKAFVSATEPDAGGNFQITYALTVKNTGGSVETYDLADQPDPDPDVTILGGTVSGQANDTLFGAGPYQLAEGEPIGAGMMHTYTLVLDAQLSAAAASGSAMISECAWVEGRYLAGNGLFNEATVVHGANNTTLAVADCGEVRQPQIDISSDNETLANSASSRMIAGTSANLIGAIGWTNSLTGQSGTLGADLSWSFMATLGVGGNVITVQGANGAGLQVSDSVTIVRVPAPELEVTNENAVVRYSTDIVAVGGSIGNGIAGQLDWTNSLTGAAGSLAAANPFAIDGITLHVGANVITVRGTNLYGDVASDSVTIIRGDVGTDLPAVDITTPDQSLGNHVSSFEVTGTANLHVIGQMAWNNSLGGAGTFAADSTWSFSAPLAVGVNRIAVTGTNLWGESATDEVLLTRAAAGLASIAVVKSADPAGQTYDAVGDVITYKLILQNTGNVTVYNPAMTDPQASSGPTYVSGDADSDGVLDVGETWVYSASYTIMQADLDRGYFTNAGTGSGSGDTDGDGVGDTPVQDTDDEVVVAMQTASVLVDKSADPAGQTYDAVGDVITYTLTLQNTGNVTVYNPAMTDPQASSGPTYLSGDADSDGVLDVDETWVYSASYTIMQADLDRGYFTNAGTGSGSGDTDGDGVGDTPVEDTDDEVVEAEQHAALEIVKSAVPATFDAVGDLIAYTFTVQNVGNVTLTNVMVVDPLLSLNFGPISLVPAASQAFNHAHAITPEDLAAGSFTNVATAMGQDPDGNQVEDEDDASVCRNLFMTPPPDLTLECTEDVSTNSAGSATAVSGCGCLITLTHEDAIDPGSCPQRYTLRRIWRAEDDCANLIIHTQLITVVDTQAPVLPVLPEGGDLGCNPEMLPVCDDTLVALDDCDGEVPVVCNAGAITGDDCNKSQVFTYTATDGCGNAATGTVTYMWKVDMTPPVLPMLPPGGDLGENPEPPGCVEGLMAADNCDGEVPMVCVAGGIAGAGNDKSQTFTYTATDTCGNPAIGTVTYTWKVVMKAPIDLAAVATSMSRIRLTWTDNNLYETGYAIERRSSSNAVWVPLTTLPANSAAFEDAGLAVGQTYFYRLFAVNSVGASPPSAEVSATTPGVPAAPANLTAAAQSTNQIGLAWTDAADNETGFELQRKTGAAGAWSGAVVLPADVNSYLDSGLAPNTLYYYRLRATNAVGASAFSSEASASTWPLPEDPDCAYEIAVTGTNLTADGSAISLPADVPENAVIGGTIGIRQTSPSSLGAVQRVAVGFRDLSGMAVGRPREMFLLQGVPGCPGRALAALPLPTDLRAPAAAGDYHLWVESYVSPADPVIAFQSTLHTNLDNLGKSLGLFKVRPRPPRLVQVRFLPAAGPRSEPVMMQVLVNSTGGVNSVGFTVEFDPAIVANPRILPGADAPAIWPVVNTSMAGRIGVVLLMPGDESLPGGTLRLADLWFDPVAAGSSAVTFADAPVPREVAFVDPEVAPTVEWIGDTVSILLPGYEADLHPQPGGDFAVTESDVLMMQLLVAGIEPPANSNEYRKADCSPRSTSGNGRLDVSDLRQAIRYQTGLDPLQPEGGPWAPTNGVLSRKVGVVPLSESDRTMTAADQTVTRGKTFWLALELAAQGNESTLGFSLAFDPALLTYLDVRKVGAANAATLVPSLNDLAEGRVGFALAMPGAEVLPAGKAIILEVAFASAAGNSTVVAPIDLGDSPVPRSCADVEAVSLPVAYAGAMVTLQPILAPGAPEVPTGLLAEATATNQIHLAWNDASDNEDGFQVLRRTGIQPWSTIAVLAPDVETYSDVGLASDQAYRYQVETFNGNGSGFSDEAEATTWRRITAWRLAKFGTTLNEGDAADAGDWDDDGVPNQVEYGLGTDPLDGEDPASAWTMQVRDGVQIGTDRFLTAIYELGPDAAPDMAVRMQLNVNLLLPWTTFMLPVDDIPSGGKRQIRVRSDQPLEQRQQEYLRMNVAPTGQD